MKTSVKKILAIPIVRSNENALLPSQKTGDVGFDVSSCDDIIVPAGETVKINTGLRFADEISMDEEFNVAFFKVEGRSGLASKGVFPVGGIIDPSYRGDIIVVLHNSSSNDHVINVGDRIAQLVCYVALASNMFASVNFVDADEVNDTERGHRGFGSSGA